MLDHAIVLGILQLEMFHVMFKLYLFLGIFFILTFSQGYAQKEMYNWYFGKNAGLNFSGTTVKPLTDGKLWTTEGCASISDKEGQLLFYTDGITIWNKQDTMQNGTELKGHTSTTQSSVIVSWPGKDSIFYVFSLGAQGKALYYSLVNMEYNGGLGEVVVRDVLLEDTSTEKLTVIPHSNKQDYWLVTHKWLSDEFHSYLITATGINTIPVVSHGDAVHSNDPIGYLKVSHDNTRLAMTIDATGGLELYDFDNTTGQITNSMVLYKFNNGPSHPYGVEFSPDDKLLYVTFSSWIGYPNSDHHTIVSQFDLSSYNRTDIINSKINLIEKNTSNVISNGALQLGPDHRIYISVFQTDSIGIIEYPNVKGIGCNARFNGLFLDGGECRLGLPNFPSFLLDCDSVPSVYQDTTICFGQRINIGNCSDRGINYIWQDGSSNPFYTVSSTGEYYVKKGKWECFATDTFNVDYYSEIRVDLGEAQTLCYGQSLELGVQEDSATIIWQNGNQSNSFLVEDPGKYTVTVSKNNCEVKDEIEIEYELCCDELLLPNLITLNLDGKNDEYFVEELKEGTTTFQVVNAWGDRIYEDREFNQYWYPANISDGIYYYIIKDNKSDHSCKSWVHIIR
jgi:hypothetical protein